MKRLSGFHPKVLALFAGVVMLASAAWGEVAQLNSIRLEKSPKSATYYLEYSGQAETQDFLMADPPRLVVDLMGAKNALTSINHSGDGRLVQGVRTSQFRNDPDMVTRIVFDLGKDARYKLDRESGKLVVRFFSDAEPKVMGADASGFGTESLAPSVEGQPTAKADDWKTPEPAPARLQTENPEPANTWMAADNAGEAQWKQLAGDEQDNTVAMANRMEYGSSALAASATAQNLANKTITLDVQGADIQTVLRSVAEFSGANIIAGPEVEGPVTVHLTDVPWKEALDIILRSNGYGYKFEYGIYRVSKVDVLQEEELSAVQLSRKKEEMEPLTSQVVRLSFANAQEMAAAMRDVVSRRGSVQVEKGSNAVIINDIPQNVERVADMVIDLDRKVSQVEIVAKLVDVDIEATREMGIKWDFLNLMSDDINANASAEIGQTLIDPFGSFRVGTVQSWGDLNATVDLLERENKANIVSHPRIVTADNKEATILVGKEIPLIVSDEAGNPITELKKIGVILRVTPHVNSDQTITMDIHPEVSELSSQATVQGGVIISLTSADTRVIVQDGETAVIGGLINEVESSNEEGLPFLKDVPLIGNLFKYSNKVKKKRELIIFITPKIVGG